MPFFRVSSLKTQLLIIVLLALLVPAAAMLYDIFFTAKTDYVLIDETEKKLIHITDLINEKMSWEINNIDEDRSPALAEIFNSSAEPLIKHYPGVRIGLHEIDTNNITVHGYLHEFKARLPEEKKARERRIYNETQAGIASVLASGTSITMLGETYDDRFLEHLVPVKINSRVIAVIWTEQMIHPIFAQSSQVRLVIRYIIFFVFGLGVTVALFTISGVVNRIRVIKDGIIEMEKDLSNRLPEMSGELGHVTAAVNEMAQVLAEKEQLIDQYRRSENLMAMGRTITEIAHELRAPVSVIQATSQAMEINIKDKPELKDYVERIERQVERHNKLINEILDFGRPDPGTIETLDINDLINSVVITIEPLFSKTDIMLEFKTASQTPIIINGNAEKLKQVFINLTLNALEAMQQHGTLTIQTSCADGQAMISVSDTGVGIPPEDLPNIFEPFYTKKARGSGLGLAISKRIIQIHGGSIEARSEAGTGSIFTVHLPLQQTSTTQE